MLKLKSVRGSIMLVFAAMIWGAAIVAQSVGLDYMPPITFNTVRCLIGGVVLLPVLAIFGNKKRGVPDENPAELPKGSDPSIGAAVADVYDFNEEDNRPEVKRTSSSVDAKKRERRDLWLGGTLCGIAMFLATTVQQIGLQYTSAGKAGFITTLYIVIVPVIGLFFGKKVPFTIWISSVLALGGLFMLSIRDILGAGSVLMVSTGDILILLCALCFSAHIMIISHFSPRCNAVAMSCIQFFVVGALGIIPMFVFEQPTWSAILSGWVPLLYTGVMSCGIAYTLQIVAQKDVNETVASVLMSLESVFSVLTGWLILNERLSPSEYIGCLLIFVAVLLAQIPPTRMKLPWKKRK